MTVKQKQLLLAFLGYYVGEIDGVWGTLSKTATLAFQEDNKDVLEVDGLFGEKTGKVALAAVAAYETKKVTTTTPGSFWDEITYFDRAEFQCTCNGRHCNGFPVEPDEKLVRILNQIRKHYGVPFSPNSAIRCKQRNSEVGGATSSQHLYGTAADISVPGVSPSDLAAYAETLLPNTGGIGIYSWGIHVDTRKTKSRWNG